MTRITTEEVTREPWKYTASQYQAVLGVHQPHICEISPMQYAHLSKRGKAQYDTKRHTEWQASADCKAEWRRLVIEASDAHRFAVTAADVTPEARDAVFAEWHARKAADVQARITEAHKQNRITGPDQVKTGDKIFDIMGKWHGTVVRVNKRGVTYQPDNPPEWLKTRTLTGMFGAIHWKPYDQVEADIRAALNV